MSAKFLLLSVNQCVMPEPVFPLGLAYLNRALRGAGFDTRWLDLCVEPGGLETALAEFKPDYAGISLRNVDDVLIRTRETFFQPIKSLCDAVRARVGCPIILGGSGFTIFPKELLRTSGADYGICGEGENSLLCLLEALRAGAAPGSIAGLVYRKGDQVRLNRPAESTDWTSLGEEDRPEAITGFYLQHSGILNIQTQRGCAHACCYCTYPLINGRTWRRRPPEAVADEMVRLKERGARYVFVVDSIFNSSTEHVTETCEAIIRRAPKLEWGCFLRPQGLNREVVRLMVRAGLKHVEFGSDSFCDSVLHRYGKQFTFADILQSHDLLRAAGIDCAHFLICGGPGETAETLEISFANSNRLSAAVIMAVVGMRIYPGTPLARQAVREDLIDETSDLLEPKYYVSPAVRVDEVFAALSRFAAQAPGWIVGNASPEYMRIAKRLRARGVVGPLWGYFATLQRIRPI